MGYAALKLKSQIILRVIEGGKGAKPEAVFTAPTRKVMILGIILATLQIADGLLTAMGMHIFGTNAEGNALLRTLMEQWGSIPALIVAKSLALSVILMLCLLASRVHWLPLAMKGVIAVYLFAAVLPWSYLLLRHA